MSAHFILIDDDRVSPQKTVRFYKQMGMPLRRKVKKRLPARVKEMLQVAGKFTQTWRWIL